VSETQGWIIIGLLFWQVVMLYVVNSKLGDD
jgi:TRAP-type C4-dicarboxylate transport system permease small subunit